VTIDEELDLLDQQLRRLKIEYDIFFNNATKRPPTDVEWKVVSLIRKFSDGARLTFSQRYRYGEMAQRYAVFGDLWRKKLRIREEGSKTHCSRYGACALRNVSRRGVRCMAFGAPVKLRPRRRRVISLSRSTIPAKRPSARKSNLSTKS